MKRSALPLVRGRPGLMRRWRRPSSRRRAAIARGRRSRSRYRSSPPGSCTPRSANQATARRRKAIAQLAREAVEHLGVGSREWSSTITCTYSQPVTPRRRPSTLRAYWLLRLADHAVAGAAHRDATELLDVDVHELARVATLVAVGRLGRLKPRALAEPDPLQPEETVESGSREDLGDLGRRHPQPPEHLDRLAPRSAQAGVGLRRGREERSSS